jgi:O-antigen ligase
VGLFAFCTPFSIAGAHTSLALAVALALLSPEARADVARLRRHPLALPVAVWCVLSIVSVVFALDPGRSFPKLKKLALLTLLPLGALPGVRRALRPIIPLLIASTAIVSVWGLIQFWMHGGGLDARLRGISGFYMTVAGILMMVGLLCLAEVLAALKDPRPRRMTFLMVSTVLVVTALAGTYTRGSWMGFVAGALYLLRRHRALLLGLAVAVGLVAVLGPSDARDRFLFLFHPDHPRNVERVLIWKHGLGLLDDRPWTGLGPVIPDELMDEEMETPYGVMRVHSHMHDTYLQIAVTMGIPGLLAFVWLIVAMFRMGRRAERAVIWNLWEQGLVWAFPACLIALLVNGLVEWNFGDSEILGLFYCLAGFALGIESSAEA